ncbi:peptidoglycan-binding protein [Streptomyces sp. SID2563]|uniref:peptidoglycan-binding protein n=1 Tax=Streptomyces sp. SID2563 TaxID=2690255 RepID=UPI00136A618E|nr:peptidoglycan-binding protein [Streptomyces sp. SID2563]
MFTLPKSVRAAVVTVAALSAVALAGPAQAVSTAPYVAYGDTGTAVKCVQIAVNVADEVHVGITVDGIWGARTEERVRAFQRDNSQDIPLDVDGVVGPNTGDVMLDYIAAYALNWLNTCYYALPTS